MLGGENHRGGQICKLEFYQNQLEDTQWTWQKSLKYAIVLGSSTALTSTQQCRTLKRQQKGFLDLCALRKGDSTFWRENSEVLVIPSLYCHHFQCLVLESNVIPSLNWNMTIKKSFLFAVASGIIVTLACEDCGKFHGHRLIQVLVKKSFKFISS